MFPSPTITANTFPWNSGRICPHVELVNTALSSAAYMRQIRIKVVVTIENLLLGVVLAITWAPPTKEGVEAMAKAFGKGQASYICQMLDVLFSWTCVLCVLWGKTKTPGKDHGPGKGSWQLAPYTLWTVFRTCVVYVMCEANPKLLMLSTREKLQDKAAGNESTLTI